jgi:hypothetical protein
VLGRDLYEREALGRDSTALGDLLKCRAAHLRSKFDACRENRRPVCWWSVRPRCRCGMLLHRQPHDALLEPTSFLLLRPSSAFETCTDDSFKSTMVISYATHLPSEKCLYVHHITFTALDIHELAGACSASDCVLGLAQQATVKALLPCLHVRHSHHSCVVLPFRTKQPALQLLFCPSAFAHTKPATWLQVGGWPVLRMA